MAALETTRPVALLAALILHAALVLYVALVTFQQFPNSGDEYAYMVSADLFAHGKLSVPSPPLREFFSVTHVINDGRYYGKYPPGWPAALALGVLAGAPWLVNLILGLATLVVIHRLARRHFGPRTANIAMYLACACPFLVFNNASFYSHPFCLFFLSLAALCAFEIADQPARRLPYVGLGLSLGLAFSARPFTTLLASGVLALVLAPRLRGSARLMLRNFLSLGAPPLAALLFLFLLYNRVQTGAWLLQPFELYDPSDRLGFQHPPRQLSTRLQTHVLSRLGHLTVWGSFSPVLAVAYFARARDISHKALVLGAVPVTFVAAFLFYWGDGWFQYGPRYLYESMFALLILAALSLAQWPRVAPVVLLAVLLGNAAKLVQAHGFYSAQVEERLSLAHAVRDHGLENAVVFVRTGAGSMAARDFPRNGIRFDGSVLFVRDYGARNEALVARFPDRRYYVFTYDFAAREGRLTPYEAARSPESYDRDILQFRDGITREPRFLF